jgi:hypothetical protein
MRGSGVGDRSHLGRCRLGMDLCAIFHPHFNGIKARISRQTETLGVGCSVWKHG